MSDEPKLKTLHYFMVLKRDGDRITVTIGDNDVRLTADEAHHLGRSLIRMSEPLTVVIGDAA